MGDEEVKRREALFCVRNFLVKLIMGRKVLAGFLW